MKKLLLSVFGLIGLGSLSAQTYPYVDINQISFVSQVDLQNCIDDSQFLGDTVRTRGVVVSDGRFSEVGSGSVAGGYRPFVAINDTANGGSTGSFKGAVIMGAFDPGGGAQLQPVTNISTLRPGFIVDVTCIVTEFNGLVQLQPLDNNSISIVGNTNAPSAAVVPASDLQDNMRQNKLPTGEQWEGSYVELQNLTVTNVSTFSSGSRTEFTVQDANGNQVLVADRFLAMRVNGISTVNPNSPVTVGSFVAPVVGARFNYIRGIIFQDQNGCAGGGGFAGGYEINPVDSTDFDLQPSTPPVISNVKRDVIIPNASQSVTITADIEDLDGVVTAATLFYTADQNAPANLFSSTAMTLTSGIQYSATIPSFPLDSVVRYFIEAVDDSSKVTVMPNTPTGQSLNTYFYTVRTQPTIMDIQQFPSNASSDASPIVGDTITVTGIVTASYQTGDLGFLYIQDPNAIEFAGIYLSGGPTAVFGFNRGDEVTVTGEVQENFGFTQLDVITASATGNTGSITPIVLDPSDPTLFGSNSDGLEKYESMLIRYQNPNVSGQVWVTDTTLNFAEYEVGSGFGATIGARVLAGRSIAGQAHGSLDVSYINDTAMWAAGLNVPAIQVDENYNMSSLDGILFYAFGDYKITPRNNTDFASITVGITPIFNSEVETRVYPNPATSQITIQIDESYSFNNLNVEVLDVTGRLVINNSVNTSTSSLNLSTLEKGIYIVRVTDNNEMIHSSKLILK